MYSFLVRPKWIGFHLLVITGIVVMINLGFWQLRRLDERKAFNAEVEARYDAPPLPLDDALASVGGNGDLDAVEWQPVTASGTYVPDAQILIVNRSQNGRAGDNVIAPLLLADGRVLLVNRGFVPVGVDVPRAPSGEIEVLGRLRTSQEHRTGQLGDPPEGALTHAQRVDIDRLAPQLHGEAVPMYVDLIESRPAEQSGMPEQITPPDLSEGPHLSYAVQWFLFSCAVAVGWVLAVRHSVRSRRPAPRPPAPVADEP